MKEVVRSFYSYLFISLIIILFLEAALEYRAYKRGYDTLFFGVKAINTVAGNSEPAKSDTDTHSLSAKKFGPVDDFPFKSEVLEPSHHYKNLIWIASASHAEGGRIIAPKVFPNLICDHVQNLPDCAVINGSKGGMTVEQDIGLLHNYSNEFPPKVSVLYQMSMIISAQQRALTTSNATSDGEITAPDENHSIFDVTAISAKIQETSLYGHLHDIIGGSIKLQGALHEELPERFNEDFDNEILSFLKACDELHIQPVLSTFAVSHNLDNVDSMRFQTKVGLVKYNSYLSPTGWIKTVNKYNERLRNIAARHDVPLIDLNGALTGKSEFFMDFVHFNEAGHQEVARLIAEDLDNILKHEGAAK